MIATVPLFHTLGTEQLVESLAIQRLLAEQTRSMADGRPVHIGPITLRARFNNVATGPQPAPTRPTWPRDTARSSRAPRIRDSRRPNWRPGPSRVPRPLGIPGVASIAWFEEWGPRGIRSVEGIESPAADALRALADLSGGDLLSGDSPDGLVWAIGAVKDRETVVLLANLDACPREITVTVADTPETVTVGAREFVRLVRPAADATPR